MEHYDTGEDFGLVTSLRRMRELEQKLGIPAIVSKRPSDQEILQVLDLAQCELREMLKRNKYMGSTALFAVDNLYEVLKAACDSEKGGEKSVSGGNMGTYKPGDERYGG